MAANRTIVVVGAGIAGLSLSLALAKFGLHVTLLERETVISELGAGLQISPNARRTLDRMGLGPAIATTSFEPDGIDIYRGGARKPIQTLTLGDQMRQRYKLPYVVMHRADLAQALHTAVRRFANIELVTGARDLEIDQSGPSPRVRFSEADGTARKASAFAVVGADGVRSDIRTRALGGPQAQYSGRVAWRTLAPSAALDGLVDRRRTSLVLGSGYHCVIYPLPHRDAINVVLFSSAPESRLAGLLSARAPDLKPRMNKRLSSLLARTGDTWTPWVVSTVRTDLWHRGAVGLIGDAAHAMLPFQAQGAAMAIEDAETLAPLLYSSPNAQHAFQRFTALRRPRVHKVMDISEANGRAFHMRWPLSLARDTVIRMQGPHGHLRRLDWLYGFDTMKSS
ncbi:FAD-dependent monooxygenase [Pelagibacterium montanilacus]|uniref:FAD-dependent monooxygenase n=1 Tax=Pelagibacterium montanilacus TaxID=2185280 RepID=UPI000F8D81C7|nr:FAD-dependent monooxygenase [Pelagibacterium montanilacus]